jgi:hypothetical protein
MVFFVFFFLFVCLFVCPYNHLTSGAGEAVAHGHVLDGEPDMDPWVGVAGFHEVYLDSEYWAQIQITCVCKNCEDFCLGNGHALDPESGERGQGAILPHDYSLDDILKELEGRFVVFKQWLVPKQRQICKKSKKRRR